MPNRRRIAEALADRPFELQTQCDTYFHCRTGRLKLREIDCCGAQLIWYQRPNDVEIRPSDYQLIDVADPAAMLAALSGALGVRAVVRKRRRIYLHRNVRIHLDKIESLGDFLEFEAVLPPDANGADEAESRQFVESLARRFGLSQGDLLSGSYGDMLSSQDCGRDA